MTQGMLDQAEFAENPEPRCPVVLLLDTSASMQGEPIAEVQNGLAVLEQNLKGDRLAALRVELAVVTFGGQVRAIEVRNGENTTIPLDASRAFVTADQFQAPVLTTGGDTPLGDAVRRSLVLLRDRKEIYKRSGVDYFRPWLFVLSDGQPTDPDWELAAEEARAEEDRRGVLVFPIAVQSASLETLARFSNRTPQKLRSITHFGELFSWVSKSLSAIAQSRPGDQVPLPPVGWAQIDTHR
jgi:uncharacterized protein YegL